jgi:hypothetical protein
MHRLAVLLCGLVVSVALAGCSQSAHLSDEEAAYLDALEEQIDTLDESLERFVALMDPANPLAAWTAGMAAEGAEWQRLYEGAQALSPPPRFAELHAKHLETLRLLTAAGQQFASAGATNDVFALGAAAQAYADAARLVVEVKQMVEDAR